MATAEHVPQQRSSSSIPFGHGGASRIMPEEMPTADETTANAYGFVSSAEISKRMSEQFAATDAAKSVPKAGDVKVVATVLPVISVQVFGGQVVAIDTNTPSRTQDAALFMFRSKSSGKFLTLTPELWAKTRAILANVDQPSGHLYLA